MADQKRFVAKNGLDNNSQTIQNVADPVNAQDASTKAFSSNASNLTSGTLSAGRLPALTGDVTSAAGSGATTLANSGVTAGTYNNSATAVTPMTVDAKGRVTATGSPVTVTPAFSSVTGKPTTLAGYGITDGVNTSEVVATAAANKLLKLDANGKLPASVTGNADGNAGTATKLQTARTINGVSFDGSANITINAVDSTARVASSEKGAANGVATLDASADVPASQLGNVIGTAPAALDTLGKIATALNNDPAAYATLVSTMDTKVATAKAEIVGGASSEYTTFAEVETALNAEAAARDAADLVLQSNIDALSSNIDASKGAANGIATLGSDGKVPAIQLPSYVDDVLEYASQAGFPATGETGKIYVAKDTNKTYRWSGSAYVYITSGAVDSVAGKTGVVTLVKADVGLANVDNTADSAKNVLSATKLTTARTLSVSGDASGSVSFDGTANAGISVTLANSGVTAGTYPKVTVDAKGRVTGGTTLLASDIPDISATYQPKNANLSSVANISTAASGLVKMTNGVASLDSSAYITGNQSITVSGDASGSGTTAISLTLANSGVTAGTYKSVTVDAKGRVTAGTNPTTLSGYGITDAASSTHNHSGVYQPLDADLTAIAGLTGTSGILKKTAADTWALDTSAYITGNQSITVSGDASGSGTTAISLTLANSGVTAGTFRSVTVDAKGRVTGGTNPTTLAGYGITDAAPLASPALTGTPTAPTAAAGTNTTQLATTAFVTAAIAAATGTGSIDGGTF